MIASGLVALAALGLSIKAAVDDDKGSGDGGESADVSTPTSGPDNPGSSSPNSEPDTEPPAPEAAGEATLCAQVDGLLSDGFPAEAGQVIKAWYSTTTTSTSSTTTTTSTVPPKAPAPGAPTDPETAGSGTTDSSEPADESSSTSSTTSSTTVVPTPPAPPAKTCTETALEKVAAADAVAETLCTLLKEQIPDSKVPTFDVVLDQRFSLYQRLAKVDRQRAFECATGLDEAIREAADKAAEDGNFARSDELWKRARTINPTLDEDGAPPPPPDNPEAMAHYLNETWSRHKGDASALGIALAALALGFALAVRIGRAWVVRRGGHTSSKRFHRILACSVLAGVAATEGLFVVALSSHTICWLAAAALAGWLTVVAAVRLARSNLSLIFTTEKPKKAEEESATKETAGTDSDASAAAANNGGKAS